jgi:hypothetical protein
MTCPTTPWDDRTMTDLVGWSLESLAKRFEDAGVDFQGDPVRWIKDTLREHIWSKQAEILISVRDNRYTAVHACHGVGKSFIASRTIAWWISTNDVEDVYVVSTAPTARQVEAILWREIKKAHKKGQLAGRINQGNQPLWKIDGVEVGMGRKPADHDAHGFQGIHARKVLIVVDEACGVPKLLWDAIDALATNELSRVLAIGNPDDPGTHFREICQPGMGWNVIRIDALRSPNMCVSEIDRLDSVELGLTARMYEVLREAGIQPSTEEVPDDVRPMLTSPLWVVERAKRWGTNSALWTSKVRGLFPDSNMEGVIPLGWVERAIERWMEWQDAGAPELPGHTVVACDVARFGDDMTAMCKRQGDALYSVHRFSGLDTMETANVLMRSDPRTDMTGKTPKLAPLDTPHLHFVVDVIGIGAGVVDRLRHEMKARREGGHMPQVEAFNASEQHHRMDRNGEFGFFNNRAAAWWNLRELLDPSQPGGSRIMLPDDDQMRADLCAPKWVLSESGSPPKIKIEPKEKIRERLGRSPDTGDTVVMAFFVSGAPRGADTGQSVPWGSTRVGDGVEQWETATSGLGAGHWD